MATTPVVEMKLGPKTDEPIAGLASIPGTAADVIRLIVEAAGNENVSAEKLDKLVTLQERILDREAEQAFNVAFQAMSAEIPEIDENGAIKNGAGKVQSRYSKYEDIKRVLTPILNKHGFALSHSTHPLAADELEIEGILTHRLGHTRTSRFRSKADTSGSKNAVQGLGSVVAYGKRYTTCDLVNFTTRGKDDDGQSAGKPEPPEDYDQALDLLSKAAAKGQENFRHEWNDLFKINRAICDYILKHDKAKHEGMKAVAQSFDRAKAVK